MKRALDLLLAVLLLPVLLLSLPLISLAIRTDSPGPALFRQMRVGRDRQNFCLFKFRTMRAGTADLPSHVAGGAHITAIGNWLRRTKLDELPQILNVLRGDMSFVGPRPCLPSQHELIAARDEAGVFAIRPGITGPAQIRGIDMSDPLRLAQVDAGYCRQRSVVGDLAIMWATLRGAGGGRCRPAWRLRERIAGSARRVDIVQQLAELPDNR